MKIENFTAEQKLQAFDNRYYQHQKWEPKKGDYYTVTRNEQVLYCIIGEDNDSFYVDIAYSDLGMYMENPAKWLKSEFTDEDKFFNERLHVPNWVLGVLP